MADDIGAKLDQLLAGINQLSTAIVESKATGKTPDDRTLDGRHELSGKASDAFEAKDHAEFKRDRAAERAEMAEIAAEAVKAVLKNTRSASLAEAVGQGKATQAQSRLITSAAHPASPVLTAMFRDYKAGELFDAMAGIQVARRWVDPELAASSKAALEDLGVYHNEAPDVPGGYHASFESRGTAENGWKATTGATGATGGYVLPNNLVDTLVKPATQRAVLQKLVTVRNGVNVRGVDQPFRTGAPSRMQFQDWNTSKENVNEAYGSYTAYLGTIARVMDITKQYARFSAGAAEADVMDELARAAILGENYYLVAGAGTGTIGSGDPTTGVYTALNATGQVAYKNAFASASNSTVAGSFASALATMNKNLADRNRENEAVLVDADTYWTAFSQGSDNAGFWMSDFLGAGFSIGADNVLRWRGVPIYYDANLGTNATTKIAIGGEWHVAKLYRGLEFRIDSSDVAGTRWDYNLIGFRGEEEIGFNANTAVGVGALQLSTAVIP